MMRKIAAVAIVAALVAVVNAESKVLHTARSAPGAWQLVKNQPAVNLNEQVTMNIGLKHQNMDLLDKIFWEVSDPKSAKYGEHLNNQQMRRLVSPGDATIDAVKAWLSRHGIEAVEVATHGDSIKFVATRGQVASLLNVQWAAYENKVTGQDAIRALGETHVPTHLESAIDLITGHRGWPVPPVFPKAKAAKKADKQMVSGPFGMNVNPDLIYKQYNETDNIPTVPAGKKNLQSFFQAQGQYVEASDLTQFCGKYLGNVTGAGDCKISKYIGGTDGKNAGTESSLDSQYIIATSRDMIETWVYTYSGFDFCGDLMSWAQDVFGEKNGTYPYVISMSYGSQHLPMFCEGQGANRLAEDTQKMGAMGISVMIASGDEGSGQFSREGYNWGYLSPSFPAEMPYVTSVGSTTFENGNGGTERAASFSGGGFSWNYLAPDYQKEVIAEFLKTSKNLPKGKYNASGRGTPDVSFLGEAFDIIDNGFPGQVAGTSCSTPSFSGMVSLLNNIRLENGKTLGFLNPLLYQNPKGFTDITSGTNDQLHDQQGWYCQAGWDPVTGLGTPNFGNLVEIVKGVNAAEKARQ